MSIVMGIDPSFTGTGIIVLQHGNLISKQLIKTKESSTIIDRVSIIWINIATVIKTYKPDLAVIEGLSFASRGRSVMGTGYLGYRLREHLQNSCPVPYIEPSPTQVKKYASGKGNVGKEIILQQVYKRWGMEFDDNNIADAYVMAQIGRAFLDDNNNLTAFQEEITKALRNRGAVA